MCILHMKQIRRSFGTIPTRQNSLDVNFLIFEVSQYAALYEL